MSSKLQAKIREIIEKPELFEPRQSNGIYLETVPEWQARALEKQLDKIGVNKIIEERDQWKQDYERRTVHHLECVKQRDSAMDELKERNAQIGNANRNAKIQQSHIDRLRGQVLDLERNKKELTAQLEVNTQAGLDLAKERDEARAEIERLTQMLGEEVDRVTDARRSIETIKEQRNSAVREVERLREECKNKPRTVDSEEIARLSVDNERLRAEIERLKFTVSATKTLRDELAMAALSMLAPLMASRMGNPHVDAEDDRAALMDYAYKLADEAMERREITVENA